MKAEGKEAEKKTRRKKEVPELLHSNFLACSIFDIPSFQPTPAQTGLMKMSLAV